MAGAADLPHTATAPPAPGTQGKKDVMENVFFSGIEWVLPLVSLVGVGFFVLVSLDRLPRLLRLEISRRVKKSIVAEHDTQAGLP